VKKGSLNYQIFHGSAIAFVSNGVAKGAQTLTRVIISRVLGPVGLGSFEVVISLTRWLSLISLFGLHQTIVQFTASRRVKEEWNSIVNIFIESFILVFIGTILFSMALYAFKPLVFRYLFEGNSSDELLLLVCLLTVFMGLANYLASFSRGLKMMFIDQVFKTLIFPVFTLLSALFILWFTKNKFTVISIYFLASYLIGGLIALYTIWLVIFLFRKIKVFERVKNFTELFRYSYPIWINSILTASRSQFTRLFIPVFSTTYDLGIFSASYTVAFIVSFILTSFTPISQTLFAEFYGSNNYEGISRVYRNVILVTSYFVFSFFGIILVFGKTILGMLFGKEFETGYWILIMLMISESVDAISGPAGNLLLMTGKQVQSTRILAIGFAALVLICVFTIPYIGALGAAIGAAVSMIIINGLRVLFIKRTFRIDFGMVELLKKNTFVLILTIVFALSKYFIGKYEVALMSAYFILILFFLYSKINLKELRGKKWK
jgi:O-antigen/teichoic acid export membrane protein